MKQPFARDPLPARAQCSGSWGWGNASITEIRVEPDGRIKVIAVGDVGHLPPAMLTGATGDSERTLAIPPLPVDR